MKKKKLEQMQDKYPHFSNVSKPGTDDKAVNAKIAEAMDDDVQQDKGSHIKTVALEYVNLADNEVESFFKAMDEGNINPCKDVPYTTADAGIPEAGPEPKVNSTISAFEMAMKNLQNTKSNDIGVWTCGATFDGDVYQQPKLQYYAGTDPYAKPASPKKSFKKYFQPGEGTAFDPNKVKAVNAEIASVVADVPVVKRGYPTKAEAQKITSLNDRNICCSRCSCR